MRSKFTLIRASSWLGILSMLAVTWACAGYLVSASRSIDFSIVTDFGAALVISLEDIHEGDEFTLGIAAELVQHGGDPCPVAVYLSETEPMMGGVPSLATLPAPAKVGEVLLETVLPPPRDGELFVRVVGSVDPIAPSSSMSGIVLPVAAHDDGLQVYIMVATCPSPQVEITMVLELLVQRQDRDLSIPVSTKLLWP